MRIESTGKYEYRKDLYDHAAEELGESARSKGLDAAAAFTLRMTKRLEKASDHPDMTPELAELLSTPRVSVDYEIRTSVTVEAPDEPADLITFRED
jgi:hypothetical protein